MSIPRRGSIPHPKDDLAAAPRDRRVIAGVVGGGVLFFLLGYALTALLFFPGAGGDGIVAVPDLRGSTLAQAGERVERVGLELARGSRLVHPRVPAGAVLAQTPLPGEEVRPGATVRVILSAGPARRPVPEVELLTADRAGLLLQQTGFRVQLRSVPSERSAGRVLGVRPEPGTVLSLPATVQLRVSAGPPRVAVPSLAGLPPPTARQVLEEAGLRLGAVEYDPFSLALLGEVTGQRPAAGDSVRRGTSVRVAVSGTQPASVPAPIPEPVPPVDSVPPAIPSPDPQSEPHVP